MSQAPGKRAKNADTGVGICQHTLRQSRIRNNKGDAGTGSSYWDLPVRQKRGFSFASGTPVLFENSFASTIPKRQWSMAGRSLTSGTSFVAGAVNHAPSSQQSPPAMFNGRQSGTRRARRADAK